MTTWLPRLTDRYHLASRRLKPSRKLPEGQLSFVVKSDQLLQALILFKPGRRSVLHQPLLTMSVTDTEVLFEAIPGNVEDTKHQANFITIGCGLAEGGWPDVWKLVEKAATQTREAGPQAPRTVALNLDYLADFQKAARWVDGWGHNQLVMTFGENQGQMILCQIGPDFIGIQMPQNFEQKNNGYGHLIREALDNWVGKIPELQAGIVARNNNLGTVEKKELG